MEGNCLLPELQCDMAPPIKGPKGVLLCSSSLHLTVPLTCALHNTLLSYEWQVIQPVTGEVTLHWSEQLMLWPCPACGQRADWLACQGGRPRDLGDQARPDKIFLSQTLSYTQTQKSWLCRAVVQTGEESSIWTEMGLCVCGVWSSKINNADMHPHLLCLKQWSVIIQVSKTSRQM